MLKIFIGADSKETIAWHVAAHSMMRRTKNVLSLTPLGNECLPESIWWRPRGQYDSTEFSNARFLVPYLCNYEGWALFVDCDVLCLTDISQVFEEANNEFAVMVRKHVYAPKQTTKFLGQPQTQYHRKNWSSLMLFNCAHPACRELTLEYANNALGLDLHGFAWTPDQAIGSLSAGWNVLVEHPHAA